jgi:MFS-type transporter involved in bile tolerance (Atg22 family)
MTSKDASTKKRGTFAWALWDWAEPPSPTIMQTYIFPDYRATAVAGAGVLAGYDKLQVLVFGKAYSGGSG